MALLPRGPGEQAVATGKWRSAAAAVGDGCSTLSGPAEIGSPAAAAVRGGQDAATAAYPVTREETASCSCGCCHPRR